MIISFNSKKTLSRENNMTKKYIIINKQKLNKTKKLIKPPTYFEVINNLQRYKKVNLEKVKLENINLENIKLTS